MWLLAIAVLHWFVFYLLTQRSIPQSVGPEPAPTSLASVAPPSGCPGQTAAFTLGNSRMEA